jgi:glutathione S-transferase
MHLELISHVLCPYVQRVSIVLSELNLEFKRTNINLSRKPDWFLKVSPLNKVPVLMINQTHVLIESSVISNYADEISDSTLLSSDIIEKHQQLAWTSIASELVSDIGHLYRAKTDALLIEFYRKIELKFELLENDLFKNLWFSEDRFTMVGAAFAPAFRYFDILNKILEKDIFSNFPALNSWRNTILERPSVISAVSPDYADQLLVFLQKQDSILGIKAKINI